MSKLHQLAIRVLTADLPPIKTFLIATDPSTYVEVIIKGQNVPKKSPIQVNTRKPNYNYQVVLLVKESDTLQFNIFHYRTKGSDTLLGTAELLIERELDKNNGEFKEKLFMLEVKNARNQKVGFVRTVLNGIQCETTTTAVPTTTVTPGNSIVTLSNLVTAH